MNRPLTVTTSAIAFSLAMLLLVRGGQTAQPPKTPPPNRVNTFMKAKLTHAQEVLRGLALEDYDSIAKNAQKISLLSLESNWNILQTPEYLRRSREFRQTTQDLAKAAKAKNLDGATLAYVKMTFNCVNCHKYVRDYENSESERASKKSN